jgi:hypothetical protein
MRFRKLRIAWSVTWGIVAVLLCVLWVRSYRNGEMLYIPLRTSESVRLRTTQGHVYYARQPVDPGSQSNFHFTPNSRDRYFAAVMPNKKGILGSWFANSKFAMIPLWFPTVIAGVLAFASWTPQFSLRFSLRTLLIAATLVAVILPLIIWLSR